MRRADAVLKPLTGELSTCEAEAFLGRLVDFGGPELMATGCNPSPSPRHKQLFLTASLRGV
ncbi:MAG: hypothetical protein ACO2PM_22125 [Pyrobaculum sp.]